VNVGLKQEFRSEKSSYSIRKDEASSDSKPALIKSLYRLENKPSESTEQAPRSYSAMAQQFIALNKEQVDSSHYRNNSNLANFNNKEETDTFRLKAEKIPTAYSQQAAHR
jgi:hypothetical protein